MLQFCWGIYFLLDLLWMVYPNCIFCNMYVIKLTFVCKMHLSRIMGSSFGFSRSNFEAHSIQFYNTFIFLTNIYSLAFSSNSNVLYSHCFVFHKHTLQITQPDHVRDICIPISQFNSLSKSYLNFSVNSFKSKPWKVWIHVLSSMSAH